MRKIHTKVDTNDADYVSSIVKVEDDVFEKFLPLIKAINNFKPYVTKWGVVDHNFEVGECIRTDLGEKTPDELYPEFSPEFIEEFRDTFEIYGDPDFGFHTLVLMEDVVSDEILIDGSYETMKAKEDADPKIQKYNEEMTELRSKTSSTGQNICSTPFSEMNDEDKKILNKIKTLWIKYQ